jgi:dipeptidyl aminopeptidase/acylaminoacyl peptidase
LTWVATTTPILYLQGTADEQVPVESARLEVARLCSIGDAVDYRELSGADHAASAAPASLLAAAGWALDRLAGKPAASTCP